MPTWGIPFGPNALDGALSGPAQNPTISTDTDGGDPFGIGGLWWERVHVHPRSIDVGNVVTDTVFVLDLFNAYRDDDRTWDTLVINASGVTTDAPGLPFTLDLLSGLALNVTVSAEGAASVDGDLTFTFEGTQVTVVPLTAERVSAMPYPPERGVMEDLESLTNIFASANDTEKRQGNRRRPRQGLVYTIARSENAERQRMENFLQDQMGKLTGIPVWFEQTRLSSAMSPLDTTINVTSTNYIDFRVDGTAIIWTSETDFEIVIVSAVNATSLDLLSVVQGSFPAGTLVMPLRIAYLATVSSERVSIGESIDGAFGETIYQLSFKVIENDVELADVTPFSTYNSKVLLDDVNYGEVVKENYKRSVVVVDNQTGNIKPFTMSDVARRVSMKRFLPQSPQELWEIRGLLHAIRGQQVSFYLPTFASEFIPVAGISSGVATLNFEHVSYTDFAQSRQPRDVVRVVHTDGTTIDRDINSSSEISATEEQIVVDSNWGQTIALADIKRVEILEKVRAASDKIRIIHGELPGDAEVMLPVRSVLE